MRKEVEVLRRTSNLPFDSGPLTAEEVGEAGRALFRYLDGEQKADSQVTDPQA